MAAVQDEFPELFAMPPLFAGLVQDQDTQTEPEGASVGCQTADGRAARAPATTHHTQTDELFLADVIWLDQSSQTLDAWVSIGCQTPCGAHTAETQTDSGASAALPPPWWTTDTQTQTELSADQELALSLDSLQLRRHNQDTQTSSDWLLQ